MWLAVACLAVEAILLPTWFRIFGFRIYLCIQGMTFHQWQLRRREKRLIKIDKNGAQSSSRNKIFNRAQVVSGPQAASKLKRMKEMSELSKSEYSREKASSIAGINIDPLKSMLGSNSDLKSGREAQNLNFTKAVAQEAKSPNTIKILNKKRSPTSPALIKPQITMQPRKSDVTIIDALDSMEYKNNQPIKTISLV